MIPVFLALAATSATVELYTIGPGPRTFESFGHAALCVAGRCYNFGATDTSRPLALGIQMARGRAQYWTEIDNAAELVERYRAQDRTIHRQQIEVADARVRDYDAGDSAPYEYRLYDNNCGTRVRDAIDALTDGALARHGDRPFAQSYRDISRTHLSAHTAIVTVTELLGRHADAPRTVFEAMFLPELLRAEVAAALGAAPEVLYERRGDLPSGSQWNGRWVLVATGLLLSLLVAAAGRWNTARTARLIAAGALTLVALHFWALPFVSALPEAYPNELMLLFVPTDVLIGRLEGSRVRAYLLGRGAGVLAVLLAGALGLLIQPVVAPAAAASILLTTVYAVSRWAAEPAA